MLMLYTNFHIDDEHVHDDAGMLHPLRGCTGMIFCINDVVQDGAGMLHLHRCCCGLSTYMKREISRDFQSGKIMKIRRATIWGVMHSKHDNR